MLGTKAQKDRLVGEAGRQAGRSDLAAQKQREQGPRASGEVLILYPGPCRWDAVPLSSPDINGEQEPAAKIWLPDQGLGHGSAWTGP